MDNAVITAIKTRRSIRRYTAEQVSDDELKAVLDAGTYAPTGHNRQDPLIVAVQNPDTIKRLSDLNARIMGKDGDPSGGQPELHPGRIARAGEHDARGTLARTRLLLDQQGA